jgi:hypothetical protein
VRLTSLWLVLRAEKRSSGTPELPKPEVKLDLLIKPGTNPNRMRKGTSGEIPRRSK